MSELTVIGDEDEAFGVLIEPACREKVFAAEFGGDEFEDGGGFSFFSRADVALRFIEHDIEEPFKRYRGAVNGNGGVFGDLMVGGTDGKTVGGDPAIFYKFFNIRAREIGPLRRDKFIYTHILLLYKKNMKAGAVTPAQNHV